MLWFDSRTGLESVCLGVKGFKRVRSEALPRLGSIM